MMLYKMMSDKDGQYAKDQIRKLRDHIETQHKSIESLTEKTPASLFEGYAATHDILKNLRNETNDSDFWKNIKEVAPFFFVFAVEKHEELRETRDCMFTEEILKTKAILQVLHEKIIQETPDVDIVDYALASRALEEKIQIMKALNSIEDEPKVLKLPLKGTNQMIHLDVEKMREAISFSEQTTDEMKEFGTQLEMRLNLNDKALTPDDGEKESDYLKRALEALKIDKKDNGALTKNSALTLFKIVSEYVNIKSKDVKTKAQDKRLDHFKNQSYDKYFDAITETLREDVSLYDQSLNDVLDASGVSQQVFAISQNELMLDPLAQMEMMKSTVESSKSKGEDGKKEFPEDLTEQKTVQLLKEAQNNAFDILKNKLMEIISKKDPMMTPVIIGCLSHDYVTEKYGYLESEFKAAMTHFKAFEKPEVIQQMQQKQFELMAMANPFMAGAGSQKKQ